MGYCCGRKVGWLFVVVTLWELWGCGGSSGDVMGM